ncbi:hypothetical protein [Winogradskyella aurantiaca]|uniref:hypothetical protein n=1 Tax=Winogradskyella aurantiaca TaxID=2219558 RepID=UPI000E1E161E|nr:hypothetical protein [Winogradskyella aurantiaca]
MKRLQLSILLISITTILLAQGQLDRYKYVVIPNQFVFLKGKDTYNLNSLTKFLFNRKGFEAYLEEDELPQDLFQDRCLAAYAEVVPAKGGFRQKRLVVVVKDCRNNILLESRIGKSGTNNHERAYQESVRDAFVTIDNLPYKYMPVDQQETSEKEVIATKSKPQAVEVPLKSPSVPVSGDLAAVSGVAVDATEPQATTSPEVSFEKKKVEADAILRATKTNYGYEVKDLTDTIIMNLLSTAAEGIYMVKGQDAIVFKHNGQWKISANDGTSVTTVEVINLKFQ